jgi:hypothetical protein
MLSENVATGDFYTRMKFICANNCIISKAAGQYEW